jgi:hypothetical protein
MVVWKGGEIADRNLLLFLPAFQPDGVDSHQKLKHVQDTPLHGETRFLE